MNKFALLLLSFLLLSCAKEDKLISSLKDKMGTSEINQMIDTMSNATLDTVMSHIKPDTKADTSLYMFIDSILSYRESVAEAKEYIAKYGNMTTEQRIRSITVKEFKEVKYGITENVKLREFIDSILSRHMRAAENDTIGYELLKGNSDRLVKIMGESFNRTLEAKKKILQK